LKHPTRTLNVDELKLQLALTSTTSLAFSWTRSRVTAVPAPFDVKSTMDMASSCMTPLMKMAIVYRLLLSPSKEIEKPNM